MKKKSTRADSYGTLARNASSKPSWWFLGILLPSKAVHTSMHTEKILNTFTLENGVAPGYISLL